MFGAGWTEMLIIGIVALVVIGPKDLPVVMRKIGRVVATVRRMGGEFQRELNKTTGLDQITDLRRSIAEPLRQTSEEIAREFNKVTTAGVEPSGAVKAADPKVESVYETIAATSGVPTDVAAPPVMKPLGATEALPAPAEAAVLSEPARKPAKPRAGRPATKAAATKASAAEAAPVKRAAGRAVPAKTAAAAASEVKAAARPAKAARSAAAGSAAKPAPAAADTQHLELLPSAPTASAAAPIDAAPRRPRQAKAPVAASPRARVKKA